MEGICGEEKEQISRFIELAFLILQHGFEEIEMQNRLGVVKL